MCVRDKGATTLFAEFVVREHLKRPIMLIVARKGAWPCAFFRVTRNARVDNIQRTNKSKVHPMHHIELTDDVYEQAKRRAIEAGFTNVEEFIENFVIDCTGCESEDYDRLFTPAVIAELDRVSEGIEAGAKLFTQSEVDEHFRKKSQTLRDTQAG